MKYSHLQQLWEGVSRSHPGSRPELESSLFQGVRENHALQREHIRRFQAKEPGAEDLLIKTHYPAVKYFARRIGRAIPSDFYDWVQVGILGLLEACARFDLTQNVAPSTYLYPYVRGYISRAVYNTGSVVRVPTHRFKHNDPVYKKGQPYCVPFSAMDLLWEDQTEARYEDTLVDDRLLADEAVSEEELERATPLVSAFLLKLLSDRHRQVLHLRFSEGKKLQDIGNLLGCSRERARQLELIAIEEIHDTLDTLGANPRHFDTYEVWLSSALQAIQKATKEGVSPTPTNNRLQIAYNEDAFCKLVAKHSQRHGRLRNISQNGKAPTEKLRLLLRQTTGKPRTVHGEANAYDVTLGCPICWKRFGLHLEKAVERSIPVPPKASAVPERKSKPPRRTLSKHIARETQTKPEPFHPYLRAEDIAARLGLPVDNVLRALTNQKIPSQAEYIEGAGRGRLWHQTQIEEFEQLVRPKIAI